METYVYKTVGPCHIKADVYRSNAGSSPAAEALTCRGFAEAIGVRAEPWTGPCVSGERWGETVLQRDLRYSRLEPLDARTRVHSTLLHRQSGVSFYDEDRKRELMDLLGFVCGGPIPSYYPGDAEVHLKLWVLSCLCGSAPKQNADRMNVRQEREAV